MLRHLAIIAAVIVVSCRTTKNNINTPTFLDDKAAHNAGLALIKADDLPTRANVSSITIDSIDMRINELRVGIESYLSYETPVLVFAPPKIGDYVEIIRCRQDSIIFGGERMLDNVDFNTPDEKTLVETMRRNDFWANANKQSGCQSLTTSYSDTVYEDADCPTGSFFYILRACVDKNRLDSLGYSTANCSRLLEVSSTINHISHRNEQALAALSEADRLRSRIDTVGREINQATMDLQQQLYACQTKNQRRVATAAQEQAISKILALGPTLGIPALGAIALGAKFRSTKVMGSIGAIAAVTPIIALAYQASTNPQSNYPQEAASCYTDGETTKKLTAFPTGADGKATDNSEFCGCSQAIGTQAKIKVLTDELSSLAIAINKKLSSAAAAAAGGN